MNINIDKGVPTPKPTGGAPRKYPFPDMEVGDSFTIPLSGAIDHKGMDTVATKVRCAACRFARRSGWKFTVRTERADGVARCWRVA